MHYPRLLERALPFHVGSFDPAVSLTEDLPQGVDADILLLGCGDARNILYTSFVEQGLPERKLDITACDVDEHIIGKTAWSVSSEFEHSANKGQHGTYCSLPSFLTTTSMSRYGRSGTSTTTSTSTTPTSDSSRAKRRSWSASPKT
jgi:hypothetical protein